MYNESTFCRAEAYKARFVKDADHHPPRNGKYSNAPSVPNYYGRYGCDTPLSLLNSTLEAMVQVQPNPDFIIFTGDSPAHHLVEEEQVEVINFVASILNDTFPGVLVIPSIGNNDVFPDYNITCNDPKLVDLHGAYQDWIPADQVATYLQMGAFAVSPQSSLLVISLNTILYSVRNNYGNQTDPCGQFEWLGEQLANAQNAGMTVYITGHILPGMDPDFYTPLWYPAFTENFIELILPYSEIIGGMFFGHVHRDEFRVLNPPSGTPEQKSEFVSLVCGSSFTPVYENNPSFRLFRSYNKSYALLDYDEIYMDLYIANMYGEANWTLEYSYSDYGEGAVATSSLQSLLARLQRDPALFSTWYDRRVQQYQVYQQSTLCALNNPDTEGFDTCMSQGN
eukprot:Phypoly_transcript_06224.p1 GENE.Phypoly_transcript_06224~~Phypoly_transcript_06224.p1  ORF type:complete len:395 (-),score=55.88 Phypoly_transcript_06224:44-1228(-)